jgi:hypothetical protein
LVRVMSGSVPSVRSVLRMPSRRLLPPEKLIGAACRGHPTAPASSIVDTLQKIARVSL